MKKQVHAICQKTKISFLQKGFTLVELAVVMGILATLLGIMTVNLIHSQSITSLTTTVDVLLSDIKAQQIKAMSGDTEGRPTASAYGIHFGSNTYTTFNGSSYPGSGNPITLDSPMQFSSVTFSGSDIIFAKASGEIVGYAAGSNTITIRNTAGNFQKTIHFNRYGIVTAID